MLPIPFPGHNLIIAENQEPYIPLPVLYMGDSMGTCLACFELSEEELAEIITTRKIWASFWTFNKAFQPVMLSSEKPVFDIPDDARQQVLTCLHGTPATEFCGECQVAKELAELFEREAQTHGEPVKQHEVNTPTQCPTCGAKGFFSTNCPRCQAKQQGQD